MHPEGDIITLIELSLASDRDVLRDEYSMVWLAQDDLLAACHPRGAPYR
ncbi:MAG: hypothetical protein ACREWE_12175 [Gammaproteobacteria bacterium]